MNGQLSYIIITAMRDQMLQKSPSRRVIFDEAFDIAYEEIAQKYENWNEDRACFILSCEYEDKVREGVAKKLGIRRHAVNPSVIKEAIDCATEEAKEAVEFAIVCANEKQSYLNGSI